MVQVGRTVRKGSRTFKRLRSKKEAKEAFFAGEEVFLVACNMNVRARSVCLIGVQIEGYLRSVKASLAAKGNQSMHAGKDENEAAWDIMYNNWAYYNADNERGTYAHYYVEV